MTKRREMDEAAQVEERKRMAMRDAESEWAGQANEEKIKIVSLGSNLTSSAYHSNTVIISSSSSSSIVSRSSLNNERDIANLDDSSSNQEAAGLSTIKTSPSRSSSASNIRSSSMGVKHPIPASNSSNNTDSSFKMAQQQLSQAPTAITSKKSTSLNGGANILEENVMSFFGYKSIDILDIKLEPFIVNQVQVISFNYIEFDELSRYFAKIKLKFPYTTVSWPFFRFINLNFDSI